jgi:murein DD-endopeptidase MepM/ murein hydrolase activator NlpD
MKSRFIQTVPAGKRPCIKRQESRKHKLIKAISLVRVPNIRASYFAVLAALILVLSLQLSLHLNNYVYVVMMNNQEVGCVEEAKDVEVFINNLTARCGDLYGLKMKPADEILLIKEFRPGSKPVIEEVEIKIREQITFLTDAQMITSNGMPLIAIAEEEAFDQIVESLTNAYNRSSYGVRVLSSQIVEDLSLEPCQVEPNKVYSPEDAVAMLVQNNGTSSHTDGSAYNLNQPEQVALAKNQSSIFNGFANQASLAYLSPLNLNFDSGISDSGSLSISVETLEEVTVQEPIPFETEYVDDEEMWIVQKEIITEGVEGQKEIIYHITRENGIEVKRVKVDEIILTEPVTQVEARGTAQVPSMGSGQFIWPVEDEGEVTPGRGFSAWHTGIDIHAPMETNILAADSGVVWFSGRGGSQGNYLIIYHGFFWTLYLHNTENLVTEGTLVEQGDVIATMGSTGRSTGPHLHFEVRVDDGSGEWNTYYQHKPIDPLKFFKP